MLRREATYTVQIIKGVESPSGEVNTRTSKLDYVTYRGNHPSFRNCQDTML